MGKQTQCSTGDRKHSNHRRKTDAQKSKRLSKSRQQQSNTGTDLLKTGDDVENGFAEDQQIVEMHKTTGSKQRGQNRSPAYKQRENLEKLERIGTRTTSPP